MSFEDLDGSVLGRIEDVPVVDGGFGHETKAGLAVPLPELDVFVHDGRLQLLLARQVEDLDCPTLRLESQNLARPMHDSTVGGDRSLDDIVAILEVDYYYLRLVVFINLLSYTNERIGF